MNKKKINILIAEDDKFLSSAYSAKFDATDFDVRYVSNGNDVLTEIENRPPDVMLLDLIMPKLNGFEVLRILKSKGLVDKFPIIVASNLDQNEDIRKALDLGAKDYIVKSNVSLEELIQKIYSLLKN